MSKPIIVETTRAVNDYPKGAELGFDSEAKARSVLDDAFKVTGYQDRSAYEDPKPQKAVDAPKSGDKG